MKSESLINKIWRCVYPALVYFVVYVLVALGGDLLAGVLGYTDVSGVLDTWSGIIAIISMVICILILQLYFRRDYEPKSNYAFKNPKWIVVIVILGLAASHGLNLLISLVGLDGLAGNYEQAFSQMMTTSPIIVIARAVILAPIMEELLFRGLIFKRLRNYTNFWIAALVSSAVFGIYHMNLVQGIYAFILGLIFCFVYNKFRNIIVPMIMHACANLLSVILYYTGADYTSVLLYVIVMIICLAITVYIVFVHMKKLKSEDIKAE